MRHGLPSLACHDCLKSSARDRRLRPYRVQFEPILAARDSPLGSAQHPLYITHSGSPCAGGQGDSTGPLPQPKSNMYSCRVRQLRSLQTKLWVWVQNASRRGCRADDQRPGMAQLIRLPSSAADHEDMWMPGTPCYGHSPGHLHGPWFLSKPRPWDRTCRPAQALGSQLSASTPLQGFASH
ncbi:hypothetical protein PCL_06050 [Purpureocillium lilacinum]|uniref:Uncharacterized protein n=1 Tax=Purpureocillium lilacinum TaxID=33203 RepID=A0A2U3ELN6_PURLI|nr:hypothetical protein Purlil1_5754 [Purpureocillium lilacinum]PWI75392.1 hypothetical protein PCL_06050 [Purpureocillium lilacinum]